MQMQLKFFLVSLFFSVFMHDVSVVALNLNCAIVVPQDPLTAVGLSSPFYFTALDPTQGPCNQANPSQSSFAQAVILDLDHGTVSVYNPLVIDVGLTPLIPIAKPTLPANYVAGLWFGTNANLLYLLPANTSSRPTSLELGNCVNGGGLNFSIFTDFASCNAEHFFSAANQLIAQGRLVVPPRGTAADGLPCPTSRDFSIVDDNPSDNVQTTYLVTANGSVVQNTPKNLATLGNATVLQNGDDNPLLSTFLDPVLNCASWSALDLASVAQGGPANFLYALPLDELQAAAYQQAPVARIPALDIDVQSSGMADLTKLNAYRVCVNQYPVTAISIPSTTMFCYHMYATGAPRIYNQRALTQNAKGPVAGQNLFLHLVLRFIDSIGGADNNSVGDSDDGLNCEDSIGLSSPFTVSAGIAVSYNATAVALAASAVSSLIAQQGWGDAAAFNDAYYLTVLYPTPTPVPTPSPNPSFSSDCSSNDVGLAAGLGTTLGILAGMLIMFLIARCRAHIIQKRTTTGFVEF